MLPPRAGRKRQADRLGLEKRRVHLAESLAHPQRKLGLRQHVALEIDARAPVPSP